MTDAERITADELNERLSAGRPIVPVDVRRSSYEESDVKMKGAVRIEPDELAERFEQIPAGSEVVTYCT